MSQLINGRVLAEKIKDQLKLRLSQLDKVPCLAMVSVGKNPASEVYLKHKIKACNQLGIESKEVFLAEKIQEEDLIRKIEQLNNDSTVDAVLIQLPLPEQIQFKNVMLHLDPEKDVDCLHPLNFGQLCLIEKNGLNLNDQLLPCTPRGIIHLFNSLNLNLSGQKVVIVGRSNLVGKPLSNLLVIMGATVTLCHSQTKNLTDETRQADILISAVGRPGLITAPMVKPGAIVIDVGITRVNDRLLGDVDFESVKDKVQAITPVPGGVGPMTIASLLENTLLLVERKRKSQVLSIKN
ncbi:bifunctional 5,10-methylenetetrahydrofolate dehydrogenase/5,10-methenyltetrahydrofolate cyclohydrolase [Patescibacteria group bacterium]|nr:bifunctional 5,10-methylenetetrahydrofolate dehydrogenase/5,10-methenyltetrahydrofolate cyclohydrolase [Patescibacteria group bacterium]